MKPLGNLDQGFGHGKVVEPSDADLWSRSRDGDRDAFGALFERYGKLIYNYCFRRIGTWETAEDLLSVVFLEAWRRRDKKLPPDKVLPWLYGIATNVVRNQRRSERRFAAALKRMPTLEPTPDFAEQGAERLDDEQQIQRVLSLLGRLPQRERDVFTLCGWMDLSYEDAAIALGIPAGTVRSRLSRARTHLQELDPSLGHEQGENTTLQETRP